MRLGSAFGDHDRSAEPVAAVELDPLAGEDPCHRHPGGDRRPRLERRLRDRERDPAHAPDHIPPLGPLTGEVALEVHQLHRRRPRVPGARVGADHALAEERVLEPLIGHVAVDRLRHRLLEHDRDQLGVAEQLRDLGPGRRRALPGVAPRAAAQQAAGAVEHLLVRERAPDVVLGEPVGAHVGDASVLVEELGVGGPVRERAPQVGIRDHDLVPVPPQVELRDHEVVKQPDDVGARADEVLGLGERLLERARAPELLATLQDHDRLPGPGQVRGSGEPVVPPADDDRVPVAGRQLADRRRQPDLPHRGADVHAAGTVSR